jgi:hypothetical protein
MDCLETGNRWGYESTVLYSIFSLQVAELTDVNALACFSGSAKPKPGLSSPRVRWINVPRLRLRSVKSREKPFIPAKAGINMSSRSFWIPAFTGFRRDDMGVVVVLRRFQARVCTIRIDDRLRASVEG